MTQIVKRTVKIIEDEIVKESTKSLVGLNEKFLCLSIARESGIETYLSQLVQQK